MAQNADDGVLRKIHDEMDREGRCHACGEKLDGDCYCDALPRTDDAFHYFRDHEKSGAWGVRSSRSGRVVAIGMDKGDALVVAVFMSGRFEGADRLRRSHLKYYPEREQ